MVVACRYPNEKIRILPFINLTNSGNKGEAFKVGGRLGEGGLQRSQFLAAGGCSLTLFCRPCLTHAPTYSPIHLIHPNKTPTMCLQVLVDLATPSSLMDSLRVAAEAVIKANPNEFNGTLSVGLNSGTNPLKMTVSVGLPCAASSLLGLRAACMCLPAMCSLQLQSGLYDDLCPTPFACLPACPALQVYWEYSHSGADGGRIGRARTKMYAALSATMAAAGARCALCARAVRGVGGVVWSGVRSRVCVSPRPGSACLPALIHAPLCPCAQVHLAGDGWGRRRRATPRCTHGQRCRTGLCSQAAVRLVRASAQKKKP
jgi:hypothetical protein